MKESTRQDKKEEKTRCDERKGKTIRQGAREDETRQDNKRQDTTLPQT
jgi:hypothetical protein